MFFYRHNPEGAISYISDSVEIVLGHSTKDMMENFEVFLSDNPINKKAIEFTKKSLMGEQQPKYPVEFRHKNGSLCLIEISEYPIFNSKGKVIAIEGLAEAVSCLFDSLIFSIKKE